MKWGIVVKGTVNENRSNANIRIVEAKDKLEAMRILLNDVFQGDNFSGFEIYPIY